MTIRPAVVLVLAAAALAAAEPQPIGYWRLDEAGEGQARDSTLARQHAAAPGVTACPGVVDGGARCTGDGKVRVFMRMPQPKGSFSYEAWVRPAALPERRALVLARNGARDGLVLEPGGRPAFALYGADGRESVAAAAQPLAAGRWSHLVGCYDQASSTLSLLVDGAPAASATMASAPRALVMRLSAGGDGEGAGLAGDVDELRVWDRPLAAEEAARLRSRALAGVREFPDLQPDRSFTYESAPIEHPCALTSELRERIAALPAVAATVAREAGAGAALLVDGRRVPLIGGQQMQMMYAADGIHIQPYRQGGMELLVVSLDAGSFHPDAGYPTTRFPRGTFWTGRGQYDASRLEDVLWRALAAHPDALLVPWIWMTSYPAFTREHPGSVIRNLRGDPMVVSSHFLRFDAKGPDADPAKHEQLAASFHSPDHLAEAEAMCAELVRAVERTLPGRRVAAWLIGGGQDAQLYDWNPPNHVLVKDPLAWGDFSDDARVAWGRWLTGRYGSAAAVSAAWGRPVPTLDPAPVPGGDDLVGADTLHHPVRGRIAVDWNRFAAEGRGNLLIRLARAVKGAQARPVPVGVCAGDSGSRKDLAQVGMLLREPAIDFHLHQPTYGQRQPGSLGGMGTQLGSLSLHGKLFFSDTDHPTWLVADGQKSAIGVISQTSQSRGRFADPGEMQAVWRRDTGWLASEGHGTLIHPILGGPWMYRDPAVTAEFRVLRDLFAGARPGDPARPEADVALIYDERSLAFLKGGLGSLHWSWLRQQQNEALAAGAPFRSYYADDVEDGLVPPAKLMVFGNALDLSPRLAAGIERLKGGGRTLVFLQGTGWAQSADGDLEAVSAVAGLRLERLARTPAVPGAADGLPLADLAWAPVPVTGAKGLDLLRAMPAAAEGDWRPLAAPEADGAALLGGAPAEHRALRLRGELALDAPGPVTVSLRADWWAELTVDGAPVLTLDRTRPGSSQGLESATVELAAGRHRVEVRLVSGSGGFRLHLDCDRGAAPAAVRHQVLDADAQAALAVTDPAARVLARYPGGQVAAAVVDQGTWKAVFVGSWCLSRRLLAQLAAEAGAWCAVPPGQAVVHAGSGLLTVHALVEGPIDLTLPRPAALEDACDPGRRWPPAASHRLPLHRGETLVLRRIESAGR